MANQPDVSTSESTALLSLEEILASDDIKTKDVEVPEWGGYVRIRQFTNEELLKYGELIEGGGEKQANLMLVMKSCIKADGTPLFSERSLKDFAKKSAKAVNRIARECLDLNGVGEGKAARAKNS